LKDKTPYPINILKKELEIYSVKTICDQEKISFNIDGRTLDLFIAGDHFDFLRAAGGSLLPLDYLINDQKKLASLILSKLKLNKTIFARNCVVKKADKKTAVQFLNVYHLLNATQSAFNLGLFYKDELVALASFSKGRKMNRLKEDQRSFELIRFCCKSGITVTGGLTRLLKNFCEKKKAGDIMTYVDKQFSDGRSFINAGFKKHGETDPNYFLIDKNTFERKAFREGEIFDPKKFYKTQNSGSIKLVFTPGEYV
jgi:hypothetical protein